MANGKSPNPLLAVFCDTIPNIGPTKNKKDKN